MCSIQDAFPDLTFSNKNSEEKVSKAKTDLLQMQNERGQMMEFQCSDITTPYFLQNNPNIPHIANTELEGSPTIAEPYTSTEETTSAFTPEIITNPELITDKKMQTLQDMIINLENKINKIEHKCKNRNSHDMILFMIVVIFVILIIDTVMKK